MDGFFYTALVAAILFFAWAFVRVATMAGPRVVERNHDEYYVVDASEAGLRGAGQWQGRPAIAGVPLLPRVVGSSSYGASTVSLSASEAGWEMPRNPERAVVWVVPGRSAAPGLLQEELARLKRVGAIQSYYRIVASAGREIDCRA